MACKQNRDSLRVDLTFEFLHEEYVTKKKSTPEIAEATGYSKSNIRHWVYKYGFIRSIKDASKYSAHKISKANTGKKVVMTNEWRENMRISANKRWKGKSKGYSLKPNGYYEVTTGTNKGRGLHVVIFEEYHNCKLKPNEVVHHKNEIKTDNSIGNLQKMTKSEHMSHHARINYKKRVKNDLGQFTSKKQK